MKYVNDSLIRKKIEYIYNNVNDKNIYNLINLLVLKNKYAKKLNYKSYFDLKMVNKISGIEKKSIKNILSKLITEIDNT